MAAAALQTGRDPSSIDVLLAEPVDWPDTSLGCAQPGIAYAQVVTPGWLIELEAADVRLTYHSEAESAGRVILCTTSLPTKLPRGNAQSSTTTKPQPINLDVTVARPGRDHAASPGTRASRCRSSCRWQQVVVPG